MAARESSNSVGWFAKIFQVLCDQTQQNETMLSNVKLNVNHVWRHTAKINAKVTNFEITTNSKWGHFLSFENAFSTFDWLSWRQTNFSTSYSKSHPSYRACMMKRRPLSTVHVGDEEKPHQRWSAFRFIHSCVRECQTGRRPRYKEKTINAKKTLRRRKEKASHHSTHSSGKLSNIIRFKNFSRKTIQDSVVSSGFAGPFRSENIRGKKSVGDKVHIYLTMSGLLFCFKMSIENKRK